MACAVRNARPNTRLARVGSACARAPSGSRLRAAWRSTIHGPDRTPGSRRGARGGNYGWRRAGGPKPAGQTGAGRGPLEVRYTALHLSAPERVEYSYKLEGLERDWVRAGSRRLINYNSLPHGTYRFVVRAQVLDEPPAESSYAFVLLPHYYETTWFRLLALALLGGLVWLGFSCGCGRSGRVSRWSWRARAAGAGNPRHAGARVRRDFVAARRGRHVHAGGRFAGAPIFADGAAHGAPQPDRSAPLDDGPTRLRAGGSGPGGGSRSRRARVDGRSAARGVGGIDRRPPAAAQEWNSSCCASPRRRSPTS